MAKVLIIEDDPTTSRFLLRLVTGLSHEARAAGTLNEGLEAAQNVEPDLILLDVLLPDGNGLAALPELARTPSSPEIIIITGAELAQGAQLAFESGAWDYLTKPVSRPDLALTLSRALHFREEKIKKHRALILKRDQIIGRSAALTSCLELVGQAALSEANVLIVGETGTGKELLARAIHENGRRQEGSFVVADCAALPSTLVESILFGHKKGAFTGADRPHIGLIKEAHRGTLFLDEVAELPLNVQTSFLRVLQERRFRPVGAEEEELSDFRVVAATNRDLKQMVREANFRRDLFFRLQGLTIKIPPLRERREDIKDLTMYWLSRLAERYGLETKGFSPELLEPLTAYDWPGNVRELINVLENALFNLGSGPTLYPVHLPAEVRAHHAAIAAGRTPSPARPPEPVQEKASYPSLKDFRQTAVERVEKEYLTELMVHANGRIKEAASLSGLSEPRLYTLLKKYKIKRVKVY
ncbi:MAG: sigma-54 dependent transcriptional regulator [Thermodesulfobacteriota bacterium]